MPDYVIIDHAIDDSLCSLTSPENVERAFELNYGVSRASGFPKDALLRMNPEYKKSIRLSDSLHNNDFLLVSSEPLKDFFENEGTPNVEYLSVAIVNHKGREVSEQYYIVNQIGTQDCIDFDQSVLTWNRINPDQISAVKKLALNPANIEPDQILFRAKHLPTVIFIERETADRLVAAGLTGIRLVEINAFVQI